MKVKVVGDPFSISGYSSICRSIIISLIDAGIDVSVSVKIIDKERYQSFPKASMIKDVIGKNNGAEISIQVCSPEFFDTSICKKNIGVLLYEASELPPHFVEACNAMDGILGVSEFVSRVCVKSGVTVPVFVAKPYVESVSFEKYEWKKQLDIPDDHKMILSCFDWSYRKGWDVLLRAYWGAFSPSDKVTLVLKVYNNDTSKKSQEQILEEINKLKMMFLIAYPNGKKELPDLPSVRLVLSKLSDDGLHSLYDASDFYVLATRGESSGITVIEAMSHSKPVIATNWGALSEFLTKENSYPLPCEIEPCMASNGFIYPITSFFAAPSVFWLSKFMSYLCLAEKDANDKFSVDSARETALGFSKEKMSQAVIDAVKQILEK